jgi:predicted DNA-binding protein
MPKKTVNTVLRLPVPTHEKLRYLAYRDNRSQHSIILELLENALKNVKIPAEETNDKK